MCINCRRRKGTADRMDHDGIIEGIFFGLFLSLVDSIESSCSCSAAAVCERMSN